jgi:ubiquinone/menaquinone biosynthesis C-methylase UbiE
MIEVSNYDFFDYDYAQYWKVRQYEDCAEKHLLEKIFNNKKGKWFIDIGGSYGRLTPTYYNSYTNPIVLDYSLKTLQKNYSTIKKQFPNVEMIAANAYHMPFRENMFDGGLMVRVLHHISEPTVYFNELKRIMHNDSSYVQEFANKVNLKASLRAIFHLNFKFFSKEPYQQPTSKNFEGTKTGEEALFFNYHPSFVSGALKNIGFEIQNKFGCSYLRFQGLKKILGDQNMLKIEYFLQKQLKTSNIPPSIVFETKLKKVNDSNEIITGELKDILVCPKCFGELSFKENSAHCECCDKTYMKSENIWDFRID